MHLGKESSTGETAVPETWNPEQPPSEEAAVWAHSAATNTPCAYQSCTQLVSSLSPQATHLLVTSAMTLTLTTNSEYNGLLP